MKSFKKHLFLFPYFIIMKTKRNFLIGSVILAVALMTLVLGMSMKTSASFFEKNIQVRKSADAESVAGCMRSCEDMLAGWLEMNPDSKNYTRQQEKIAAKAEQCLAMNELAGFPVAEQEILAICGQQSSCVEANDCVFRNDLSEEEIAALPACTSVPPCDDDPLVDPNIFGIDEDGNLCDAKKQCDGTRPECVEIPPDISIDDGVCTDISFINELNLSPCCTTETPRGIDCGADEEWVVGVAAFPVCFIPNS